MEAVVVTHNSEDDLPGLLASGHRWQAFTRVIVVDNASTDGSVRIARAASRVDTVEQHVNVGFGAAVNEGARRVNGSLVCVLNPDVRIADQGVIGGLARHFSDPTVAIVAPRLVLPDGTTQGSARAIPLPLDLVRRRVLHRDVGALMLTEPAAVPWVVGAFMLIRREAFDLVGGFDERYHLYFEDVDLCLRLRQRGFRVIYDPTVRVLHEHKAASRKSLIGWSTRQHVRSALRFYALHPRHLITRTGGVTDNRR